MAVALPSTNILLLAGVLLAGCRPSPAPPEPEPGPSAANEAQPARLPSPPDLPLPDPVIDREALLLAVTRAASEAAAGVDDRESQRELDGRRFRFTFRFGCGGPSEEGQVRWFYDQEERTLRVAVAPATETGVPAFEQAKGRQVEGYAVFRVERPWLLTSSCPAIPVPAAAPAPAPAQAQPDEAGGRVLLTQILRPDESRSHRPPESYRAVQSIAPQEVPSQGLNFTLEGRLTATADGRVIRCELVPRRRPDCLVSIRIDRARVSDPARRAILADWGQ